MGVPDRAISNLSNVWEAPVRTADSHYTYFVPVTSQMVDKKIDAIVLVLRDGVNEIYPRAYVTAYPIPFKVRELVLSDR